MHAKGPRWCLEGRGAERGGRRTFYVIERGGAGKRGCTRYDPAAAWEEAALEVVGDWRMGGGWHLLASLAYQRLLGDAATSPLVQTRSQKRAVAA